MFERLIDLVINFLELFKFWIVIDEFERGVVLTLGKPRDKRFLGFFGGYLLEPGIHWVWPMAIESVLTDNVVPTTVSLKPQSLTTKDGASIVISVAITWKIKDIRKLLLDVEDADGALVDSAHGAVCDLVSKNTWADIQLPEFSKELTRSVRKKAFRWGIEVDEVYVSDKVQTPSIRIIGDINPSPAC